MEAPSAAGLLRLLVVDGEVEEGDLGGAGVSTRGSPVGFCVSRRAAADRQVSGQRDLDLKPYLSVLGRQGALSRSKETATVFGGEDQRTKDLDSTSHLFVFDTLDLMDVAHMWNQSLLDF